MYAFKNILMVIYKILQGIIIGFLGATWLAFFGMYKKKNQNKTSFMSFKHIEKYKYVYFIIGSFAIGSFVALLHELLELFNDSFSLLRLVRSIVYFWALSYPFSFYIYELIRKRKEGKNNNQEYK